MDWIRFAVHCPPAAVEAVVAVMHEVTSAGPAVEDAAALKRVSVYVPDIPQADEQSAAIKAHLLCVPAYLTCGVSLELSSELVREEEWAETWKEFYHPIRAGQRLVIKPSWEPWPPQDDPQAARPDDVVIELDPGMAFGTGNHATTFLILLALEDLARPGMRVVDAGCGSGILSLASVKLGASCVVAVDVDPVAVQVARDNVRLARAHNAISVLQGGIERVPDREFDLVLANISAPVVRGICPDAFRLLRPGGYYVTSGFTDKWVEDVKASQAQAGLHIVDVRKRESWRSVIGRKPR